MAPSFVLVLTLVSVWRCYAQATQTTANEDRLKLIQQAAAEGNADAQNGLGVLYEIRKDYAQAAAWYRKSAEQGNADAQEGLGSMYRDGTGVPRNYAQAAIWFRKAADRENASAQYKLGDLYYFGDGVPQDYAEAARWYRKAANQGLVPAENRLGTMYGMGLGVPHDLVAAAYWEKRAAEQGSAHDQINLGVSYENGYGVIQDYIQAYMWYNIGGLAAAMQGGALGAQLADLAMKYRDEVAGKMSREQIAQAQEIARNWKPTETGHRDQRPSSNDALPQLKATGTGFFVTGQGHLVTNYHVIEGCSALKALTGALSVIARDEGNDLALLKSMKTASKFATFNGGPVRVGQSVMAVGYPLRGLLSSGANVTMGNVSALAGPNDDTGLLQITAPVQPGNSGGPLMDQSGNVVGVVASKLDTLKIARATGDIPQNVNFAIKGAVVRSFLEANGIGFSAAASAEKLDPAVIAERATKFTVVVECWK